MALTDTHIVLVFLPWALLVMLGHVAKQEFRAHLRRRHPEAYRRIYGVHADRRRHSALDPVAWLLQLRFEMSSAWRAFDDQRLEHLGRRLRQRMLGAVLLYFGAIGWVLAAGLPLAGP